jgi:hypothetical protein
MVIFDAMFVLLALTLLFVKHFIVDFPLQVWSYQYENKGTYGHFGGILHSGLHGIATFLCFFFLFQAVSHLSIVTVWVSLYLALVDAFVHYHIDWVKMNMQKKMGWGPTTHAEFWILLGVDQLLHSLTYLGLVWLVVH